jgi:PHS family inorganic phosphate transporter-like MFS transporter
VFGYLGDKLGRKHAYGVTLLLMIFFAVMSGAAFVAAPDGSWSDLVLQA